MVPQTISVPARATSKCVMRVTYPAQGSAQQPKITACDILDKFRGVYGLARKASFGLRPAPIAVLLSQGEAGL